MWRARPQTTSDRYTLSYPTGRFVLISMECFRTLYHTFANVDVYSGSNPYCYTWGELSKLC